MKKTIFLIFIFLSQAFAEKIFFEAEDMTVSDTQKWQVVEHFPGWYYGFPSNGKMLRGSIGGQAEAKKTVEIKSTVENISKQFTYLLFIAIIISFFGAYIISNKFTEPILKIKNAAKKISEGDYDIRLYINTDDEIEELSNTINVMAENLSK
ncbi:MAG: HAMP domain-containing protein, partial [Candidatus Omnitrophica bacterium]|nr:HAMP domain-containing protein [Candidatus Omnitrophota bacterium]